MCPWGTGQLQVTETKLSLCRSLAQSLGQHDPRLWVVLLCEEMNAQPEGGWPTSVHLAILSPERQGVGTVSPHCLDMWRRFRWWQMVLHSQGLSSSAQAPLPVSQPINFKPAWEGPLDAFPQAKRLGCLWDNTQACRFTSSRDRHQRQASFIGTCLTCASPLTAVRAQGNQLPILDAKRQWGWNLTLLLQSFVTCYCLFLWELPHLF